MINKIFMFLLAFLSSNLYADNELDKLNKQMENFEQELIYGINKKEMFSKKNIKKMYTTFQSTTFQTEYSEKPLLIIFNGDLKEYKITEEQEETIKKNKRKNMFIYPNIISLNSSHNKSFSFSFYKNSFYDEPLKSITQNILLFHEIGHFYASNNINYYKEFDNQTLKEYKFKLKIEESFSDLNALSTMIKFYNIKEEHVDMFFNSLSFYRNQYKNYLYESYLSIYIYKLYYKEHYNEMKNKNYKDLSYEIFQINKKILLSNYKEIILNMLPNVKINKEFISLKEFFIILNENNKNKFQYKDIKNIFS
jgi:hypothetical protein